MPSSKNKKKRKRDLDSDTTGLDSEAPDRHRHKHKHRNKKKSSTRRTEGSDRSLGEADALDESLSVEATNALRAKLGLVPLEVDDDSEPKIQEGENGEKVFIEHGIKIVHKAPKSQKDVAETKRLKEKFEDQKQKRQVYSKVLKTKRTLAETDSEDENTSNWIEKSRKIEEQVKLAEKKAKELDEMDNAFGISGLMKNLNHSVVSSRSKPKDHLSGGLIVGHSVDDFAEGQGTVLVLQDKEVLDENEDEVLINQNMLDDQRHKRNVELRKRKFGPSYDEEIVDEYGQVKKSEILAKYDEVIDGQKRKTFKLDSSGIYQVTDHQREEEDRPQFMKNKALEIIDSTKYSIAKEFYTPEEMVSFRNPKKKKSKVLKASDLELEAERETEAERLARTEKLRARRGEENSEKEGSWEEAKLEEGELPDDVPNQLTITEAASPSEQSNIKSKERSKAEWKSIGSSVDVKMLSSLAKKITVKNDQESDDEVIIGQTNLSNVVIDDDAEDELNSVLSKSRQSRLIGCSQTSGAESNVPAFLNLDIKEEAEDSDDEQLKAYNEKNQIVFDSTSEQYKSIGRTSTYDLFNSKDVRPKIPDDIEFEPKRRRKSPPVKPTSSKEIELDDNNIERNEDKNGEEKDGYTNILGEKDVTKGVAAMLKLAGQKGYLESSGFRNVGDGTLKQMLESKRFSRVEQGRYDIEDKTMRKLERMGTTGTGPIRSFPEKKEYKPQVDITYADRDGRLMDSKEAFRVLSWKFHGKGPGKKQIEKHQAKLEKKKRLKNMNSSDTPLGTLSKQLKKQEMLQTPYIILSGSGKDTGAPLQKD